MTYSVSFKDQGCPVQSGAVWFRGLSYGIQCWVDECVQGPWRARFFRKGVIDIDGNTCFEMWLVMTFDKASDAVLFKLTWQ